jgi:hypothetical protein
VIREADPPRWQLWAVALVILGAFFGHLLLGREVFYGGDAARLYLAQQQILATSLSEGALPWWSVNLGAGYPLIAEGETAALSPITWLLHALFSPEVMLTVNTVLHVFLAGVGAFGLARAMGISAHAALLSGVAYALGGFTAAHMSHVSVISVSIWLPWLLWLYLRALDAESPAGRRVYSAALAAVVCLQFLGGHMQMSLLVLLALAGWAAYLLVFRLERGITLRRLLWPVLAILAGTALAAPQLLATLELAALSHRAGGLETEFFTSYSFHPLLSATYLSPYILGNPYPHGSIELMSYTGLLPLALAGIALTQRGARARWFFAALALGGWLLALGSWNPVYSLLVRVPVLNLFRAPARYLLWTSLSVAILCGFGLDRLMAYLRVTDRHLGPPMAILSLALAAVAAGIALLAPNLDTLVAAWRWIPLLVALAIAAWILGTRHYTAGVFAWTGLVILCADLYAYNAVLNRTYNASWPLEAVRARPAVLDILSADQGLFRTYTREEIIPVLSVQRASLYPNIAAVHGTAGVNIYMPLMPHSYVAYMSDLDANRLNRLNVRYYLIPQLLPVDETSELYDVLNPLAALPYGETQAIDINDVVELRVESYLSHAVDLVDGDVAAHITLGDSDGRLHAIPLRAGIETAEWAYERSDTLVKVRHGMPDTATTFPARSGFPAEDHPGYTYLTTWRPDAPISLQSLTITPVLPEAYVRIERIVFVTSAGDHIPASHLLGLGDHTIIYRSEDVLVYENRDVWPRAYALPLEKVHGSGESFSIPSGLGIADLTPVRVVEYAASRVRVEAQVDIESLLVLGDQFYPGWQATVDGALAPIYPVEGMFRGLVLTPGRHTVQFTYRPWWAATLRRP